MKRGFTQFEIHITHVTLKKSDKNSDFEEILKNIRKL